MKLNTDDLVYVAGHRGLVGAAILRRLVKERICRVLFKTSSELDLRNQHAVDNFFANNKPAYVFLCAARVGGIQANSSYPADFIRDNLQIQTNVIDAAYRNGVRKLVFLGSSCIYPKLAQQPIQESSLLTGPLEPTNEFYAIAKIAGLKMCVAYRRQYGFDAISVMPTNIYGPGDHYDLETSHVIPALLRKFHEAKIADNPTVTVWGTGSPRREFMHVDDLADACVHLLINYSDEQTINIGVGKDISISDLALLIQQIVGYDGDILFDTNKPDGTPQKLLNVSRLHETGWKAKISLEQGLREAYEYFVSFYNKESFK
ncbi:GDP-L-fucose synthase [Maridesulfovibrio ferrireducens]|uniref:GDP-L-fucose synthase n=1 Tax=Maridesulfovibrio ferrireducens TaxID=246191 RepID=A0A1G9ESL1_9BACT|nr:GDP-L-fucose synthase [Maridesulfovibrio ferrireducens]SDK79084.1 GDP-L-fucose synthase [Maridesulfovibrio ferrireducens]